MTNFGPLACACVPAESLRVIGDAEEDWVWVISEVGGCYHMEGCHVVDYYCDELEDVDGDECSVFVVGFEQKCLMFDLLGKSMCHQKPSLME